jgi:hypothetical protein
MEVTEENIGTSCMSMYNNGLDGCICSVLSSLLTEIRYPEQFLLKEKNIHSGYICVIAILEAAKASARKSINKDYSWKDSMFHFLLS